MMQTKLNYSVVTSPDPLITGRNAALIIIATNESKRRVQLAAVKVSLHVGQSEQAISADLGQAHMNDIPGWKIEEKSDGYELTPASAKGTQDATGAPPAIPHVEITRTGLVMMVPNLQINPHIGITTVTVTEVSLDGETQVTGTYSQEITKVPPELAIHEFSVTPAQFAPGQPVMLSWDGSEGATFVISYPDNSISHVLGQPDTPLPAKGKYEIAGLERNTNFTLIATKAGVDQPSVKQAEASVERAQIVSFTADKTTVLYQESLELSWVVEADEINIEPGGYTFHGKPGETMKGSQRVTLPRPNTDFTLTAKSGSTMAQGQISVTTIRPELEINIETGPIKMYADSRVSWHVRNSLQSLDFQAVGKLSGGQYRHDTFGSHQGNQINGTWHNFWPFPQGFGVTIGEPLILTLSTPWYEGEPPNSIEKEWEFHGLQDMKLQTSFAPTTEKNEVSTAIDNYISGGTNIFHTYSIDEIAGRLKIASAKLGTARLWKFNLLGSIQNATSISVQAQVVGGDDDWQQLWAVRRDGKINTLSGYDWKISTNSTPGHLDFDIDLILFAPEEMLEVAKSALLVVINGPGGNVYWPGFDWVEEKATVFDYN